MALQSLNAPLAWPGLTSGPSTAPALSTADTLDGAGDYTCVVICAPSDMTVSHVGFKCNAVAGSPTATVRIETVDAATGAPSGTLWATNTSVTTATLTSSFALHALTASATITKGQVFAIVITYASGTSLVVNTVAGVMENHGLPYKVTNITGSAVKAALIGMDLCLGSSTTEFYSLRGLRPAASIAANAFNNTSSAKRGVRFQVPFKCTVSGFKIYTGTAVGDFNAIIEDDSGTELSSTSTAFEGDVASALASAVFTGSFDNTVDLSPGVWYRLAIQPSSATNVNMYTATLPSSDPNYAKAWPGGANFYYSTFTTSTWTDANTQVPYIDLLINRLDDGVSSGSARVIGG
jgi:hypothetical protein